VPWADDGHGARLTGTGQVRRFKQDLSEGRNCESALLFDFIQRH
jgi:hypothetical protein